MLFWRYAEYAKAQKRLSEEMTFEPELRDKTVAAKRRCGEGRSKQREQLGPRPRDGHA